MRALAANNSKNYDLLSCAYVHGIRYAFLNINFGFSSIHRVKPSLKRMLGPTLSYYLATAQEIILFKPWDMTLEWDRGRYSGKTTIVLIANVERSAGGSMAIGPGASPTDGKMTVTIIPYKSKFDCMVKKFPKTPTGKIIEEEDVKFFQTNKIVVESSPSTDIEFDGDLYGNTPATVELFPKAISIISLRD